MAPDTPEAGPPPGRPTLQQMGKTIVRNWQLAGINATAAQHDPEFHERVQNVAVAKPLVTLLRFRYAAEVAAAHPPPPPLAPRLFLSAFLCLGPDFLYLDDPREGELHQTARDLLTTFEQLCADLLREEAAEPESTAAVRGSLRAFMELWDAYAGRFKAWKKEDAARLVEHYIATYCEVERARRSLADRCIDQVPQFLQDIRGQLQRIGGSAAVRQLETELLQQGLATSGAVPPAAAAAGDAAAAAAAAVAPEPPSPSPAELLRDAETKAKLAYDSVCDFAPANAQQPGPEKQLMEIAARAFWDVFEAEVSADPPVYHRIPGLLEEVTTILTNCVPKDAGFADELRATLDWDVLQHSLTADTLKGFLNFVTAKVLELEAPVHNEETQRDRAALLTELDLAFTPALLVRVLRFVMTKLRQLQEEVTHCRVRLAKAVLKDQAVEVQRRFLHLALASGRLELARTREWIEGTVRRHFAQQPKWLCDRDQYETVVRRGLLDLIQVPVALRMLRMRLPESLRLDVGNLEHFQNQLQHVTIVACLVNIVAMLCAQKRLGLTTEELRTLQQRLDEALQRSDINLTGLVDLLCEFATQCLSTPVRAAASGGKLTPADTDMIQAMVGKTVKHDDAVFMAFRSKIVQALEVCMQPPPHPDVLLTSATLSIVEPAVRKLGAHLRTLHLNTVAVYGQHYYNAVLGVVLHHEEPAEDLTRSPSMDDVERASLEGSASADRLEEAEGEAGSPVQPPAVAPEDIDEL